MAKYYFSKSALENYDENCYPKSYWLDHILDEGLTEMVVYPAKMITGESFAYCQKYGEPIETGDGGCGKHCEHYSPRNGKNGRCRFSANCYEPTDEEIVLKLNPTNNE